MPPIIYNYDRLGIVFGSESGHWGYTEFGERDGNATAVGGFDSATAFTLTGYAVGLLVTRKLGAVTGDFALTGYDASLPVTRLLAPVVGDFALDGYDVSFPVSRLLSPEVGVLDIVGYDVGFPVTRILAPATGEFEIVGYDVEFPIIAAPSTGVTGTRVPSMWYKRIREQREKDTARQKVLADIEMDAILMACAAVIDDEEATWLV